MSSMVDSESLVIYVKTIRRDNRIYVVETTRLGHGGGEKVVEPKSRTEQRRHLISDRHKGRF